MIENINLWIDEVQRQQRGFNPEYIDTYSLDQLLRATRLLRETVQRLRREAKRQLQYLLAAHLDKYDRFIEDFQRDVTAAYLERVQ